jgi:glycosyltransferase involved in cell wall biosynthesis
MEILNFYSNDSNIEFLAEQKNQPNQKWAQLYESEFDLSVILPAFNEENNIRTIINRLTKTLNKLKLTYELIIVDDGSTDGTKKCAIECANNKINLKIITYKGNMGKGYAIKKGFEFANGNIVLFLDCDLDIQPEQINGYLKALNYGEIVIASKRHPKSVVEVSLVRKSLSYFFHALVNIMTGLKVNDTQTGLKAVQRKPLLPVFSVLTIRQFAFDVELLVVARLNDLTIVEMPVKIKINDRGFKIQSIWDMFLDLMRITYRLRVTKWYQKSLVQKIRSESIRIV